MSNLLLGLEEEYEVAINGNFSHVEKEHIMDTGPFIVAGFANFAEIDTRNERIPLPVITRAFKAMMKIRERRNLMLQHSNYQVGRILEEYTDQSGRLWKSGPMENGLFIVAEVFRDRKRGLMLIDAMKKGHYLEFSVGGLALKRTQTCAGEVCWSDIMELELNEITSCDRGVNQYSKGFLMKEIAPETSFIDAMLIKQYVLQKFEEKELSDPNMEPTKSDMQIMVDAVAALTQSVGGLVTKLNEEPIVEDPKQTPEPLTAEKIAELIKTAIDAIEPAAPPVAPVAPVEPVVAVDPAPAPVEPVTVTVEKPVFKAPEREDYETDDEYADAEKKFKVFKASLMEEVKGQLGDTIVKSQKVPDALPVAEPGDEIDIAKLYEDAADCFSLKDLIKRTK